MSVNFSGVSWTPDGKGFFYSRYDEPPPDEKYTGTNYYQKLYFHRLGTPQSADRLVYERPDEKEWGFGSRVTDDGRYLAVSVWRGTERANQLFYLDLHDPQEIVIPVNKELLRSVFEATPDQLEDTTGIFYRETDPLAQLDMTETLFNKLRMATPFSVPVDELAALRRQRRGGYGSGHPWTPSSTKIL
jgi:prolyl oligopeptidase